jgi:hypothetical protein
LPSAPGTYLATVTLASDANFEAASSPATAFTIANGNAYLTWAGGAACDGDANGDGVINGMAWVLGAPDPNANAAGRLPVASYHGTHLRISFRCLKSTFRVNTQLRVEASSDMGTTDPWKPQDALVPDVDATVGGIIFDTTDDGEYILVTADIPTTQKSQFARLIVVYSTP